MNRRQFFPAFGAVLAFSMLSPRDVFARQRRVSDFLRAFSPVYDSRQDWNDASGSLLTGISGHSGNFHVYVDGQRISRSVDQVSYDPDSQRLQIRRAGSEELVFNHDPRRQTAPISL